MVLSAGGIAPGNSRDLKLTGVDAEFVCRDVANFGFKAVGDLREDSD